MHDVTGEVMAVVASSNVQAGTANVFNVGSTAAIGSIEYEPGLQRDLPEILDQLMPPSTAYGHEQAWHDGNGHSHLRAALLGPSLTIPILDGQLTLGTWQQILFIDFDVRARSRRLVVQIVGEA